MSMFDDEIQIAPGPAAVSANGNGPQSAQEPDAEPSAVITMTTAEWIAFAPPGAILATAMVGAAFVLFFLGIAHAMKGANGNPR